MMIGTESKRSTASNVAFIAVFLAELFRFLRRFFLLLDKETGAPNFKFPSGSDVLGASGSSVSQIGFKAVLKRSTAEFSTGAVDLRTSLGICMFLDDTIARAQIQSLSENGSVEKLGPTCSGASVEEMALKSSYSFDHEVNSD
jgi:hypothetical protein